jgi:hypothetical protein
MKAAGRSNGEPIRAANPAKRFIADDVSIRRVPSIRLPRKTAPLHPTAPSSHAILAEVHDGRMAALGRQKAASRRTIHASTIPLSHLVFPGAATGAATTSQLMQCA